MKKLLSLGILVFIFLTFNIAKASTCPFSEQLELGSKNESVGILQSFMLNTLKIYNGPVTNFYGPLTMAAVKSFQDNSGLLQTGKVDQVTASALCKIYLSYKVSEPLSDQGSECFIKTLGIQKGFFEDVNEEVKELQKYLNRKGYYPENVISGYFGAKTESALKLFQSKNNISPSGIVDDMTFKAICGYESNQADYCPFVTPDLSVGYFEEPTNEVKVLQMVLGKLGVLEEKYITGYFGKLTSNAVKAMQTKSNLSPTGILNLETRQVLCKLLDLPMKTEGSNPYESADSKIDLTLSGISVLPEVIDVKTKVAIIVKIKNIGTEDSKSVKGSLYMNDKEITKSNISVVKTNEEVVAIVNNWTCEEKGIYALKIFIDSENNLIEKNKYNNILVLPINCGNVDQKDYKYICNSVTKKCDVDNINGKLLLSACQKECGVDAGLPDLTITNFTADRTTLKPEEVAMISITEKNIGKSIADYHKVKMTTNDKPEEANWGPLEPGSSNTYSQVKFTCITPGTYNIKIETDSSNSIKEIDETNNSAKLTINCTDKDGKVVNTEPGKENDGTKQPPTDPGSKGKENPKDNPKDDTKDPGPKNDTPIDEPTQGKPSLFKSNKPDAVINKKSGKLEVAWFNLYPNDCYNCPMKRCGMGSCKSNFSTSTNKYGYSVIIGCPYNGCIDKKGNSLSFYRESPHKVTISYYMHNYSNLYNPNGQTYCTIDVGDGTTRDCSFKGFSYNGADEHGENNSEVSFEYTFTNTTDKPIEVCPKLKISDPVSGDKLETALFNQFCDSTDFCKDGREDATKCLMIYPEGWGFQTKEKTNNNAAYYVTSFTARPNPGKVKETTTFYYTIGGLKSTDKAWCRVAVDSNPKHVKTFECTQTGSFEYTYSKAGTYTPLLSADEDISFLDCAKKGLDTVSLIITNTDGSTSKNTEDDMINPPPKEDIKYDCINKKCIVTTNGSYKNDPSCGGNCAKSDTPPPTDDKNDIGLVCEVKQTAKPLFEAVSVEMTGKIKSPGTCKSFTWYWDRESGSSYNSKKLSFVDNDAKKTTIDINMPLKAVCDTDSKIYGSTVCKTSFKKDQSKDPVTPLSVATPSWFDSVISSIFSAKKAETQDTKKYKCVSGVCKESTASDATTLEKCMPGCLNVTNQFPSINLKGSPTGTSNTFQSFDSGSLFSFNSGTNSSVFPSSFGTSQTTSSRFSCDWTLQRCKPDPTGISTDEDKCNESCKSKAFTNNSISSNSLSAFSSLGFSAPTVQSKKYKCNSSNECVEASNLDKNTFLQSECSTKCKVAPSALPSNNTNANFNSNLNFNLNFNQ